STSAWDWIMSIDTHWYSTIFGWYTFSGIWVSGLVTITLIILYLKRQGLLAAVKASHLHDMGKWIFAISFLWSYLWFFQFMLIWYADIPEEITYFQVRLEDYKIFYFTMFLVNFALPMLFLMDRDNKRNPVIVAAISLILILGHWADVYMMIVPGVLKGEGGIGLLEGGMFLGVAGLFIFAVFRTLSKAPLLVQKSPFLEESIHFEQ
ncbi:MAG: quinol:cytochrome C oxidoreductase, partial [Flavobacteriales bacterium]